MVIVGLNCTVLLTILISQPFSELPLIYERVSAPRTSYWRTRRSSRFSMLVVVTRICQIDNQIDNACVPATIRPRFDRILPRHPQIPHLRCARLVI